MWWFSVLQLNSKDVDVTEAISKINAENSDVEAIIDFVNNPQTHSLARSLTIPGGIICLVGLLSRGGNSTVEVNLSYCYVCSIKLSVA
jgi:D-arabinose 1-dehydrogenase-like Zn-dependent alcohol dehydrogenase